MSRGKRRALANLVCRALNAILPPSQRSWSRAIHSETSSIPDDTEALLFALSSLWGLLPEAAASRLHGLVASFAQHRTLMKEGSTEMAYFTGPDGRPWAIGMACATGAVILGAIYLALAGAPTRYIVVNCAALGIGLSMFALLDRARTSGRDWGGPAIVAVASALGATALLGSDIDGAARWAKLGGFVIQPSFMLAPLAIISFAKRRDGLSTAGVIAIAAAFALQPDRAMAGMLVLGLATIALTDRDRNALVALSASVMAWIVTIARADWLPAVPYVDRIFYQSFDVHVGAGVAVIVGSLLLLAPAVGGWNRDRPNRLSYSVFGAVWGAAILAAALGNYPTPVVGYGGSAIIGYVLSLLALPRRRKMRSPAAPELRQPMSGTPNEPRMYVGLA